MKTFEFDVQTNQTQEMIDVSTYIRDVIKVSKLSQGKLILFCPHTTAGLTINENADPDVVTDMIHALNKVFPVVGDYLHFEGNSHAHLKSSFVGVDQTVLIEQSKPLLGIWQSVYFCEFDGPRKRKLIIRVEGIFNG